jgi:serine/threonine protein kinase
MSFIDLSQDFGQNTQPLSDALGEDGLPMGFVLGGCQILERVRSDSLSILYLAHDSALQRNVLIREHFPAQWVVRQSQSQVVLRPGADPQVRDQALQAFLQEARWLVRLDHPNIVKVYRFWEQNQTAYMMMPFYQGETLASALLRMRDPVSETWLRQTLLAPLLGALKALHELNCYHLAIAPERIWLTPDNKPIVLDLSDASQVVGALAPGQPRYADSIDRSYAPIEQFSHGAAFKVGPWTDVYALAAVAHHALVGYAPTSCAILGASDQLAPLAETLLGSSARYAPLQCSIGLLSVLDKALFIQPQKRYQSAAEFEASLLASPPDSPHTQHPGTAALPSHAGPDGPSQNNQADPAAQAAIALAISSLPWVQNTPPAPATAPAPAPAPTPTPTPVRAQHEDDTVTVTIPAAFKAYPRAYAATPASPASAPSPTPKPPQVMRTAPAQHVEPVFQPPHSEHASNFAAQWIQPALTPPASSMSARPAPVRQANSGHTGRWVGVLLVLSSVIGGLGWWYSGAPQTEANPAQADAASAPAQLSPAAQASASAVTPANAASAASAATSEPLTNMAPSLAAAGANTAPSSASANTTAPPQSVPSSNAVATVTLGQRKAQSDAPPAANPAPSPRSAAEEARKLAAAKRKAHADKALAAAATTPRGTCSGRSNFSLVYCMQNQCSKPVFSRHSQCVAFRIDGEVR